MLSSFSFEKKPEPTIKISHSLFFIFLVSSSWQGLCSTPRRPGVGRGICYWWSWCHCHRCTLADFPAARESIFAESRERWMYFQVCLWCSIVRLMNGTDISTKKKKMIERVSFSKARSTSISLTLQLDLRVSALLLLPAWPLH